MSHHVQVEILNLPLCTWCRTQIDGINYGMIYAPSPPTIVYVYELCVCVKNCDEKKRVVVA